DVVVEIAIFTGDVVLEVGKIQPALGLAVLKVRHHSKTGIGVQRPIAAIFALDNLRCPGLESYSGEFTAFGMLEPALASRLPLGAIGLAFFVELRPFHRWIHCAV